MRPLADRGAWRRLRKPIPLNVELDDAFAELEAILPPSFVRGGSFRSLVIAQFRRLGDPRKWLYHHDKLAPATRAAYSRVFEMWCEAGRPNA